MTIKICPCCGSSDINRFENLVTTENDVYYKSIKNSLFIAINYKCNSCKEEGDFFAENDHLYKDIHTHALQTAYLNLP